jgi:hypothetical protein
MNNFRQFESNFKEVFQKTFPNIEISPFIYSDNDGINYIHFLIPPQNKNLIGSNYYLDKTHGFYHFTNISALQSIVSTKTFRLYNLNHLKDPREFLYAGSLIPQDPKFIEDAKENFYILSFCQNIGEIKDSEKFNIWRLYGDDGSGCIIKLAFVKTQPPNWHNFYLSKLYYGINERLRIQRISKLLSNINKDNKNLGIDLGQILCFHKSSLYRSEREVRLLYDKREKKGYGYTTLYDSNMKVTFPTIRTEISNSFDPKIKFLELPILDSDFKEIDEHIPFIIIGQVIIGYRLKKQFEEIKQELTSLFDQKLGYIPSIILSRLSKTFWGTEKKY